LKKEFCLIDQRVGYPPKGGKMKGRGPPTANPKTATGIQRKRRDCPRHQERAGGSSSPWRGKGGKKRGACFEGGVTQNRSDAGEGGGRVRTWGGGKGFHLIERGRGSRILSPQAKKSGAPRCEVYGVGGEGKDNQSDKEIKRERLSPKKKKTLLLGEKAGLSSGAKVEGPSLGRRGALS